MLNSIRTTTCFFGWMLAAAACGPEEDDELLATTEDALAVVRNVPASGACRTTAAVNRISTADGPRIQVRCAMTCEDGRTMTIYLARFERLSPDYAVRAAEAGGPAPGTLVRSSRFADRAGRYRADCRVALYEGNEDPELAHVIAVADCAPSAGCVAAN